MGISRKLEDVHRGLVLLVERGKVKGFLENAENAQRIDDLVEDIHEALMKYQVCASKYSFPIMSDVRARSHYNKISTTRIPCSSWVPSSRP